MKVEPKVFDIAHRMGLILKSPAAKSMVYWRAYGIDVIDNLFLIFRECLLENFPQLHWNEHKTFFGPEMDGDRNNFEFNLNGSTYAVKSETLYDDINSLLEKQLINIPSVSLNAIYRNVSGKLMYYDKRIFPTISANIVQEPADVESNIFLLIKSLDDFFRRLLIPVYWIRNDNPYKDYFKWQVKAITPCTNGQIISHLSLYLLSDQMKAKVGTKLEILDLGLTQRTLYALLYLQAQSDNPIVLPTSIAPCKVLILNSEQVPEDLLAELKAMKITHESISISDNRKQSGTHVSAQRGIPLELYRSEKGHVAYRICKTGTVLRNIDLLSALKCSDQSIYTDNQKRVILENGKIFVMAEGDIARSLRHEIKPIGKLIDPVSLAVTNLECYISKNSGLSKI